MPGVADFGPSISSRLRLRLALRYRPEIDGLRAVAVVPVILFHAGFSLFGGGFVGVDVFFVISGFLITSNILEELQAGTFSVASFYERRARRILPALFLVILCCIPFAWMWMMPVEMKGFAVSMASVAFFASNILSWWQSGYFDAGAELKPLLHTWSLAVEEQYYIVFPVALLSIWRLGRRASVFGIAIVALLSFLLCEGISRTHPDFAFYWAITRAWELMAGALCAFATVRPHRSRDNLLSAVGLALIVGSIFLFDGATRWPSLYSLLPVGGACMIIVFGTGTTLTARLLSVPPIIGIGLMSYSAYLWHQPLFAFARIRSTAEPSMWLMSGLCLAVFPLAWVTWKYVEVPFRGRGKSALVSRSRLIQLATASAAIFIGLGVSGHFTSGFVDRVPPGIRVAEERLGVNYGLSDECDGKFTLSSRCRTTERPTILLWGDSFAMHWAEALRNSTPPVDFIQMTMSSCTPVVTHGHANRFRSIEDCGAFNHGVLDYLKGNDGIKTVIIASSFTSIVEEQLLDNRSRRYVDGSGEILAEALTDTIRRVRSLGKEVLVVAPLPSTGTNIGRCLLMRERFGRDGGECNFSADQWLPSIQTVYAVLGEVESSTRVLWPHRLICIDGTCMASRDGVWIYRDDSHLSREGSDHLGKLGLFKLVE